jgi:hypothetical protein
MTLELFLSVGAFAAAILAGFWALGRLALAQLDKRLDERFAAQERAREEGRKVWDERIKRMEGKQEELDRDLRKVLVELPREYVRREDHIRFETVINAKLDALHAEMRLLAERQMPRS